MNILFINANLYGHINPTLGLVRSLTCRGNKVDYYCSEQFAEKVKEAGADWIGYSSEVLEFLSKYRPTDRHPFYMLMEYILAYDEFVLPEIMKILNKDYDLIICDSIFGGASFLRRMVKTPVACSHSSFALSKTPLPPHMLVKGFHPQLDNCYDILSRICSRYNIEEPSIEEIFVSKGERNVVYTTQAFNGDNMLQAPEYLYAGPSMNRQETIDVDFDVVDGRKIIYISLGSVNTNFLNFYRMCLDAFMDMDYYVYMSVGHKVNIEDLGVIPKNFTVREFLPQLAILQHADLFVTHAGFNSTNEALTYGVPMLALPQVNDQYMVAKKIDSMKLGVMEKISELTKDTLRTRVKEILDSDEIQQNCKNMASEMKKCEGTDMVAAMLEQYVQKR